MRMVYEKNLFSQLRSFQCIILPLSISMYVTKLLHFPFRLFVPILSKHPDVVLRVCFV